MELVKTILIVVVVLIIVYLIINVVIGDSTQLTNMLNGNEKQTILANTLKNNYNSSNYTYSAWFYVNDWNYRYGETKILLTRLDSDNNSSPSIVFDAMENNITVSVSCYPPSGRAEGFESMSSSPCGSNDSVLASTASIACINSIWQQAGCTPNLVATADPSTLMDSKTKRPFPLYTSTLAQFKAIAMSPLVAQNKQICYPPTAAGAGVAGVAGAAGAAGAAPLACAASLGASASLSGISSLDGSSSLSGGGNMSANSVTHQCVVKNFPLQKWVNLIVSVYGRTLDIYIDGKLVRTCILPGVAKVNAKANIVVTPNGGFNGWTSNFKYWAHASNPQEAYNIYKKGFGGSMLGNLFNKYRIKFSFLADNKEVSSVEI